MQELSLMEKFADPSLFDSLSFGEKLAGSGVTAIMGMGITFAVLIFIWLIIAFVIRPLAKAVDRPAKEKAAPAAAAAAAPAVAAPAAAALPAAAAPSTDGQIAAVIAAAIAAYEGEEEAPRTDLNVRRISRISAFMPSWRVAGNNEAIESRKL